MRSPGPGGKVLAELLKLCAQRSRSGVMQVVEDVKGFVPGMSCPPALPAGQAVVAQVGENLGFAETVTGLAGEAESLPVTRRGLSQVAEAVLGVAQAVPRGGLVIAVTEFAVHRHGTPAECPGLLVVAEQGVTPAD